MRKTKIIWGVVIVFFLFIGLNTILKPNYVKKNFMSIGVSTYFPENFRIGHVQSKIFKYNDITIPTIEFQGIKDKDIITLKTFPFSIDDYTKQFKSAFDGKHLKEVKYDYKKYSISNKFISKVLKSKAILKVNGEKRYNNIFVISFKNQSGTLIVEIVSDKDEDYSKMIDKMKLIKIDANNIAFKPNRPTETKDLNITKGINIPIPSDMNIISNELNGIKTFKGVSSNHIYYISASTKKIPESREYFWKNINGYEIIKKYNDKNFLVHDLNLQTVFFMESEYKEVKDTKGQVYYIKIDKLYIK